MNTSYVGTEALVKILKLMFLPGLKIILDVQRPKEVKTGLQITDKHYFSIFYKKILCIIDIYLIAYQMLSIVVVYIMTIDSTTTYLHTASSPHNINPKVGLSGYKIIHLKYQVPPTDQTS